MQFLVILALAIALLAVVFAIQNQTAVAVSFFIWNFETYLAVLLLSTLAVGVLIGLLVSIPSILKRSWSLSRQKRHIDELHWQVREKEQLLQGKEQEKHEAVVMQRQTQERLLRNTQELLNALAVTEPQTGLLSEQLIDEEVSYLLNQMTVETNNPERRSVSVYALEAALPDAEPTPHDYQFLKRLYQSIGYRLQSSTSSLSWLHHDGKGRFTCIVPGLDLHSAADYGESIKSAFANEPLKLEDGTPVPITVSVGGAIAQTPYGIDTQAVLHSAQAALEHAQRRGKNRFHLVEVGRS